MLGRCLYQRTYSRRLGLLPLRIPKRRWRQRPPRSGRMAGHSESLAGTAIRAPAAVLGRALCGDSGSYSGHKLAGNQFRNIPSSRVAATHVPRAGQTRSRAVEGKPATRRTGHGAAASLCCSAGLKTRAAFSRLRGGILLAASTGPRPRPRHGPEVNRLWCIL